MKTIKNLSLVFLAFVTLWSCSDDDDATTPTETQELNIVETAQATPSLSILVEAVVQAGLVDDLSASGSRTVLAPTNAAFTAFLQAKGFATLADVPNDVLKEILLNHVIDDTNIMSSDLTGATGYTNTLASGPNSTNLSLFWDGTDGVTFNGASSVAIADISASNGIVHVVDAVIDLPTIATFATTNPALTNLVEALQYADTGMPTVPYIATVSDATAGPFTVFAPTDAAFGDLLVELEITALTDLATETVDAALTYHIVSANVQSSMLTTGPVATLGGDITADATLFTLTDVNDRVSNIVTTLVDIQAVNGVVHVIDNVLLPQL